MIPLILNQLEINLLKFRLGLRSECVELLVARNRDKRHARTVFKAQ
jgi:hypothetical protein